MNVFEINAIRDAARKMEYERRKFEAMLHKGVDLDEETQEGPTFEDVKRRAQAKLSGVSEDAIAFGEIGIQIIEE